MKNLAALVETGRRMQISFGTRNNRIVHACPSSTKTGFRNSGLPDGTRNLKPKFPVWINFGGSCNGIFYGHLVHFTAIWYILWSFSIFSTFWYVVPRKIWQPCFASRTDVMILKVVSPKKI
jgi:hypothetical protein